MSKKEVPAPTGDAVLVTAVPQVNVFYFSNEDGTPLIDVDQQPVGPVEPPSYGAVAPHMERLSAMVIAVGRGEHSVVQIHNALGNHALREAANLSTTAAIGAIGRQLREYMPLDVMSYHTGPESSFKVASLTFGELALASRPATEEELAAYNTRLAMVSDPTLLYERERTVAEEDNKINLMSYDHALIDFRQDRFLLNLDDPNGLLALRLIQAVAAFSKACQVDITDLVNAVWEAMPLAERMLFTDQEAKLYGKTGNNVITKQIKAILNDFTGRILMTRRGRAGGVLALSGDPITVQLEVAPPETPYGPPVRPVLPPGTHRDKLNVRPPEPLTTEELTTGAELFALAQTSRTARDPMTQGDALDILDFIMSGNGKRALREALGPNPAKGNLQNALDRLHAVVRGILGNDSYYVAYNDRTIFGRSAKAYGGRKGNLQPQLTTKWHIVSHEG